MSDLIRRNDAIAILGGFTQTDPLGHTPRELINAVPSVPTWIPCSEHHPCKDDEYLVTWRGTVGDHGISHRIFSVTGLFIIEHTDKDGWNTDDIKDLGYEDIEILAWRPLPEPYKEDQGDEL